MSLLSNFELAESRKKQLEGLPINPTGVVLEKIVSPTEALINGKIVTKSERRKSKVRK